MTQLNYDEIVKIQNNPGRAVNLILNRVSQAINGDTKVFESLTHPFPVMIDTIAANAFGLVNRIGDAEAGIYYQNANKAADLYRHMADSELWGLFGTPSSATIRYAIPMEEITRLSVPYEEKSGTVINNYRKLVIPKDTSINVYGINFMTMNPVEIRLTEAGYVQVVYDVNNQNPFFPVRKNILDRYNSVIAGNPYLFIDVPVKQLEVTALRNLDISPSAGLKGTVSFTNKLYGVRAFMTNQQTGVSTEIQVVYTNEVYDAEIMTVSIIHDQDNGTYTYEVPDTYINSGRASGKLTLMTYTTLGAYTQGTADISEYKHTVTYRDMDYDNERLDKYSAPIRSVNNSEWKIQTAVTGGTNPRTFAELKQARRENVRINSLPVSDNQLSFDFESYGYRLVKSTSYSTGRLFQLTRDIPNDLTSSGDTLGCYTGSMGYSVEELKTTGVVYDNGKSVTIPPNTLIKSSDYGNFIIPEAELQRIKSLGNDQLVDYTNSNFTVVTPYHYVIDANNDQVAIRPYLLDKPSFGYQSYLYERVQLGIELGIGSIGIQCDAEGYLIKLITRSDDNYKKMADESLSVQLFFQPADAQSNASLKGTLLGKTAEGERVWSFRLGSNFNVDKRDYMSLTGFQMFGEPQSTVLTKLNEYFGILFLMEGSTSGLVSESDGKIDTSLYSNQMMAMAEVGYNIILGKPLNNLYSRIRPIQGGEQYKRYEADVPETYTEDMFKRNDKNQMVFDETTQKPILEHRAGDVVYNPDGTMQIKYPKGSYVRDDEGGLVLVDPVHMRVHFDFFGFDGVYSFSNDDYDAELVTATKDYISNVVMQDMTYFASRVLDLSRVAYQPRKKLGYIDVVMNSQTETTVQADLTFQVLFYLTQSGFQSETLREALLSSVESTIETVLSESLTFAKSALVERLRGVLTTGVIEFKVNVFAGTQEIDVITNKSGTTGFGVRKLLELTGDEIRSVKKAIAVNFVKHMPENNVV